LARKVAQKPAPYSSKTGSRCITCHRSSKIRLGNAAASEALQLAYRPPGPKSTGYAVVLQGVKIIAYELRGRADDSASSGGTPTPSARPKAPIYASRDQW